MELDEVKKFKHLNFVLKLIYSSEQCLNFLDNV